MTPASAGIGESFRCPGGVFSFRGDFSVNRTEKSPLSEKTPRKARKRLPGTPGRDAGAERETAASYPARSPAWLPRHCQPPPPEPNKPTGTLMLSRQGGAGVSARCPGRAPETLLGHANAGPRASKTLPPRATQRKPPGQITPEFTRTTSTTGVGHPAVTLGDDAYSSTDFPASKLIRPHNENSYTLTFRISRKFRTRPVRNRTRTSRRDRPGTDP